MFLQDIDYVSTVEATYPVFDGITNLLSPFYENFIPVFGVSFKHDHLLLSKFFTGAIQFIPGIIVDILLVRKFCCVADKLINKRKTFLKSL